MRQFEIDTAAAALMVRVPVHTIRNWAARGHLQPLRANGTRTMYDADAVARTARRFGYLPDLREEQDADCCAPHCNAAAWPDVPVPLCQKHAVAIWLHVNDELERRVVPASAPDAQSVVYFIQAGECVKIGTTTCLPARLDTLRVSSGATLKVLLAVAGGRAEEKQVHALFAADRIRGEWFRPSAVLADFIAQRQDQDIRNVHGSLRDD